MGARVVYDGLHLSCKQRCSRLFRARACALGRVIVGTPICSGKSRLTMECQELEDIPRNQEGMSQKCPTGVSNRTTPCPVVAVIFLYLPVEAVRAEATLTLSLVGDEVVMPPARSVGGGLRFSPPEDREDNSDDDEVIFETSEGCADEDLEYILCDCQTKAMAII